jgi:pilus assembly protein Flp/PilA
MYLTTHLQTFTKRMRLADRLGDRGATMVEYGLLVALIAVIVIPALVILGPKIATLFTDVAGKIGTVAP